MTDDSSYRSGACGLTLGEASEPHSGPASVGWEEGAYRAAEAKRVWREVMGDRHERADDDANESPRSSFL